MTDRGFNCQFILLYMMPTHSNLSERGGATKLGEVYGYIGHQQKVSSH